MSAKVACIEFAKHGVVLIENPYFVGQFRRVGGVYGTDQNSHQSWSVSQSYTDPTATNLYKPTPPIFYIFLRMR